MASLQSVETAILGQVNTAISDLTSSNGQIQIMAAVGWPPTKLLQNNVRDNTSVVSIYDRKMAKNSTRWKPVILSSLVTEATLTGLLSQTTLAAGRSSTLTLGGSVTIGDTIALVTQNSSIEITTVNQSIIQNSAAQIAVGGSTDTPATIAAALTSAINSDPIMSTWVSASSTGSAVTITSLLSSGTIYLQANIGNGGTNTREIGRRERSFQIVIWSPTSDIRSIITAAIETMLQQLELNFSLTFPDGSYGRLYNQNDFDLEDATIADTYRHDFIFCVDYPITEQDIVFSVLAPIAAYEIQ